MTDVTKFIDKETGNIHVGEVVIGRDLKWEDAEKLAPYAEIKKNDRVCSIRLKQELVAEDIPAKVKVVLFSQEIYSADGPTIEIMCYPPAEAYLPGIEQNYVWLEAGKKWLKAVLGEPSGEGNDYISYHYDWGSIAIYVDRDGRNDLRGGEIKYFFKKD